MLRRKSSMKTLGIDYGKKRIGLAISDESQSFARELAIVSPKEFWDKILILISENQITQIALGWPLNMSGEMTDKTKEVERFKIKVESKTGLPVEIIDERLTSQMAESISGIRLRRGFGGLRSKNKLMSEKKELDSLAARILLQNYLDKKRIRSLELGNV